MPDNKEKFAENVPGEFYVSKVCIGCTVCAQIAPGNFSENEAEDDYDFVICYVSRQPDNPVESALCVEAMEICPANAIHNDGLEKASSKKGVMP